MVNEKKDLETERANLDANQAEQSNQDVEPSHSDVEQANTEQPVVGVIMGSQSDWETMRHACEILEELEIPYEKKVVSAHRTPDVMFDYANTAVNRGIKVIIAGAGGAAHLPGMVAAKTVIPVIGVPIKTSTLNGLDSLLSIVQMPSNVPVATMAIGQAGAINAAWLAAQILAIYDRELRIALQTKRDDMKIAVIASNSNLV